MNWNRVMSGWFILILFGYFPLLIINLNNLNENTNIKPQLVDSIDMNKDPFPNSNLIHNQDFYFIHINNRHQFSFYNVFQPFLLSIFVNTKMINSSIHVSNDLNISIEPEEPDTIVNMLFVNIDKNNSLAFELNIFELNWNSQHKRSLNLLTNLFINFIISILSILAPKVILGSSGYYNRIKELNYKALRNMVLNLMLIQLYMLQFFTS